MEARIFSAALILASLLSLGAGYRTQNFIIAAATPELAQEIGDQAEAYRRDLANEWLGKELPPWPQPCPIRAEVSQNLGAGGATSFMFEHGQPFGWRMNIQGSRERVLDSVLPHEITHTIFATHFGRPLPRWADEGACTTVEHASEKDKQHQMLYQFLTTNRGIAFNDMFAMTEYPADILPLYSQGFSLARFLIAQGGKRKFVEYVGEGMRLNNWTAATKKHYGFASLSELQVTWLDWVRQGCPAIDAKETLLADSTPADELPAGQVEAVSLASYSAEPEANEPTQLAPQADRRSPAAAAGNARPAGSDGWYARQRDRVKGISLATTAVEEKSYEADLPLAGAVREQSVTRVQGLGGPQQIILDSPPRTIPDDGQPYPRMVPILLDASRPGNAVR